MLTDGPDPDADPVGYALAQVGPLRQIKPTSDQPLQTAIDQLASAYQRFYAAGGVGASVKRAVDPGLRPPRRPVPRGSVVTPAPGPAPSPSRK